MPADNGSRPVGRGAAATFFALARRNCRARGVALGFICRLAGGVAALTTEPAAPSGGPTARASRG